ncbi:hypothetical protein SDC9_124041 [bioreactor metagenome]|uniref:Rubrerythrin diiron-binding domain-containing protein n=1 Tax=bioreactor metagenome TaxID=1076179 RepID=A0A645CJV5_9ZZZZ
MMSCGSDQQAELKKKIIAKQADEFTEYHIYSMLAKRQKNEHNKAVLQEISQEEKRHCEIWQEVTCTQVKPRRLKILIYSLLERIFGFTFAIKIMERGEDSAGCE